MLAAVLAILWLITFVALITTARRLKDTQRWLDRALRQIQGQQWGSHPASYNPAAKRR